LEWVFKYYTVGCPDWQWKYNYDYPPLLSDLAKHIPRESRTYCFIQECRQSLTPEMQLLYVFPKDYLSFVMTDSKKIAFLTTYGEYYPDDIGFEWAFCKYFWEAHVKIPDIPIPVLYKMVAFQPSSH
jgi:5'-3' exonuclease